MENQDLKVRIESHLSHTLQVVVYPGDEDTKYEQETAWAYPRIAPQARFEFAIPGQPMVSAATGIGFGCMTTRELPIGADTFFEIVDNDGALDIRPCERNAPDNGMVTVCNRSHNSRFVIVSRGGKPVFTRQLHTDTTTCFSLPTKLCVVVMDTQSNDAVTFTHSTAPVVLDYEGQSFLRITLEEDAPGSVTINHSFGKGDKHV